MSVIGPITKGKRRRPWSAPQVDLEAHRYVMEEYFLDGTATAFQAAHEFGPDGHWEVREAEPAEFRTRFLVVRPSDATAFNGTVLLHWLNVSAGWEAGWANDPEVYNGYAWVGASVQKVGIDGFPASGSPFGGGAPNGEHLKLRDPERYGSLVHPGDQWSYDMFTQIARNVGPERAGGEADPMGGLAVGRVVALGGSQSAARLFTYINAVHPRAGVLAGFLPSIGAFRAASLRDEGGPLAGAAPTLIRDDLDVPVMVVNSEAEVLGRAAVPLPVRDRDGFRLWEVAGTPHTTLAGMVTHDEGWEDNPLTFGPVLEAAYRRMHEWLTQGRTPPQHPYVEVAGDPPAICRDQHGNAIGGVRLPEMGAPTKTYEPYSEGEAFGRLWGRARPLSSEELAGMYGSEGDYVARYVAAADAAVAAGALLPEAAARLQAAAKGGAEEVRWPWRGLG